jgi:hypothetical protein
VSAGHRARGSDRGTSSISTRKTGYRAVNNINTITPDPSKRERAEVFEPHTAGIARRAFALRSAACSISALEHAQGYRERITNSGIHIRDARFLTRVH